MNLKLLLVLIALSLTACAGRTTRDDSPESDLDSLTTNASRHLSPRTLPNGKTYCLEDARTEQEQDDCAGDLEDGFYASEQDKSRALTLVLKGIDRLRAARMECRWYELTCKRQRRELVKPP